MISDPSNTFQKILLYRFTRVSGQVLDTTLMSSSEATVQFGPDVGWIVVFSQSTTQLINQFSVSA